MGLIFYLSSQTIPPVPSFLLRNDKISHFLEYALLGLLLSRALDKEYSQGNLLALEGIALAIAILYAASDEFHQKFTLGRQADFFDWLVDSLGSAFGTLFLLIKRKKGKLQWPG